MTDMTAGAKDELKGAPRKTRTLRISRDAFAPFGDLIEKTRDGAQFGSMDAKLDLSAGTPRLYIMTLPKRGLVFRQITRHRKVTQCLAAVGGGQWFLAVSAPNQPEDLTREPGFEDICGFFIPGDVAIKLHRGTWHAGPFFEADEMSFFNLELSDTNETDHQNSYLEKRFGWPLSFDAEAVSSNAVPA